MNVGDDPGNIEEGGPVGSPSITSGIQLEQIPVEEISNVNNPYVRQLSPLSQVGYNLAKIILAMISVFMLFAIGVLIFSELDASKEIQIPSTAELSDPAFEKRLNVYRILQEEKQSYRDFIVQISQMILLNLLLPTLTAILGYIFGSKAEERNSQ